MTSRHAGSRAEPDTETCVNEWSLTMARWAWTGFNVTHDLTGGPKGTHKNLDSRSPRLGLTLAWGSASVAGIVMLQQDSHATLRALSPVFIVPISMGVVFAVRRRAKLTPELSAPELVG